MLKLLLIFILALNLNASYLGNKAKKGITSKVVSTVVKKNTSQDEHLYRWHGGNFKNPTSGKPINPDFKEEF